MEVALGRVLLGVLHTGPDTVPRVQRTFPRGGGFLFLQLLSLFLWVVALMMAV